jgi:hypothetical protein
MVDNSRKIDIILLQNYTEIGGNNCAITTRWLFFSSRHVASEASRRKPILFVNNFLIAYCSSIYNYYVRTGQELFSDQNDQPH